MEFINSDLGRPKFCFEGHEYAKQNNLANDVVIWVRR